MFSSTGVIRYDPPRPGMKHKTKGWAIVSVSKEITRYYRYWVNKETNPLKYEKKDLFEPAWNAHISIVRGEKIDASKMHLWKKYDKQRVEFEYSNNVYQPKPGFFVVDVFCPIIDNIRDELGLKTFYEYHLTIGRSYQDG